MKVNQDSVNKDQYGIYTDLINGQIIAIDKAEEKKIQEAHKKHKKQEEIPDALIVNGRLLAANRNGHYEDNSGVTHEYKVKNLKFASSKVEWV